jgi:hypothetical protein
VQRGLSIKTLGVDRSNLGAVENLGAIHFIQNLLKSLH